MRRRVRSASGRRSLSHCRERSRRSAIQRWKERRRSWTSGAGRRCLRAFRRSAKTPRRRDCTRRRPIAAVWCSTQVLRQFASTRDWRLTCRAVRETRRDTWWSGREGGRRPCRVGAGALAPMRRLAGNCVRSDACLQHRCGLSALLLTVSGAPLLAQAPPPPLAPG